jgi:MFS family permease
MIFCGIPTTLAVTICNVEGLGGLGGRLALGVAADRIVKPVLIAGLVIQALAAGTFAMVSRLEAFYAVAALFGFAYGGVMPLYAVLAREYFGQKIMGGVLGAASMVSSVGMALGPVVGGWIFDRFGGYAWLYIGSFAMGAGAVAIAFTFPRLCHPPQGDTHMASKIPAGMHSVSAAPGLRRRREGDRLLQEAFGATEEDAHARTRRPPDARGDEDRRLDGDARR